MIHWASFIGFDFADKDKARFLRTFKSKLVEYEPDIAWLNPSYLHMTLAFIGWLQHSDVGKLSRLLNRLHKEYFVEDIEVTGRVIFLVFGARKEYVCAEVKRTEPMDAFYRALVSGMIKAGVPPKEQSFIPHISLGRFADATVPGKPIMAKPFRVPIKKVCVFESVSDSESLASSKF